MKLLLADSVRLAITTRQLTTQETAYLNDKKFFPVSVKMATDGLALIVNKQNTDSLITVDQFKEILTGKVTDWKQLLPVWVSSNWYLIIPIRAPYIMYLIRSAAVCLCRRT